jgi:hypothetical protein
MHYPYLLPLPLTFLEMASREAANNILSSNTNLTKKDRLQTLRNAGYSRAGAYKVLTAFDTAGHVADGRISNGAESRITGVVAGGLVHSFNNATHKSLRKTAKKFNVSHTTISNTLKRYGVMCHKRKSAPLYTPEKKKEVRKALGRLYREHLTNGNHGLPFIVMDDETYITQNDEAKFSCKTFYAKDPHTTPEDIRTCGLTKFPFKVGLWYAISDHGVSDYFVWQQGLAIDAQKYKIHCLQQRLIPFINRHYPDRNCIFWPDKASSHYAKSVLCYLESKQIPMVYKHCNPTNVPQCRPIENLHAEIKRRVFSDKFHPNSAAELQARLCVVMDNLKLNAPTVCHGFSSRVRVLVDKAYRRGVLSVHK